jgi:hypothetical protein
MMDNQDGISETRESGKPARSFRSLHFLARDSKRETRARGRRRDGKNRQTSRDVEIVKAIVGLIIVDKS